MIPDERLSLTDVRIKISKYMRDAAKLARGERWETTSAYLDGLKPDDLADQFEGLSEVLLKKVAALRNAAPTVRGETISITRDPAAGVAPNAPSLEDVDFMARCRKQLLERGFVLASDADTYEEIAKRYPDYASPARVRGSEARRWIALHDPQLVARKVARTLKRRR